MKPERTIEQAELDAQAARLRSRGLTYRQIAQAQGVSAPTAHDRVRRAIAAVPVEAVTELREIELHRLDMLLEKVMEKATSDDKGFLFAVDRALAIADRRAKLLGLDAPQRHEVITLDAITAEIQKLEAALGHPSDSQTSAVEETPSVTA